MDKIIPGAALDSWCYVCLGSNGSRVLTDSQAEAQFWHCLGYVVRQFLRWAM